MTPSPAQLPAPGVDRSLAPGFAVRRDPRVRRWADGSVLIGGAPWRISRIKQPVQDLIERLSQAGPSGLALDTPLDLAAGRVLVDRGFAIPIAPSSNSEASCTIVVPVLDSADILNRLLASLGDQNVIVVDDGSTDPMTIRDVADRHGARVVRHEVNQGPAAARNTGLAAASTEFVAFIDADCTADPSWPASLLGHFADPLVAMVAPRVEPSSDSDSLIERYETTRSSLDMGNNPELVRLGARLGFLPSAAVVVRAAALRDGGFDADLRLGEDVDLTWRLSEAGWLVRYDPSVRVCHQTRTDPRDWLMRRYQYGTSAASLEARHPGSLTPARVSSWNVASLSLIGSRHTALAAGVTSVAAAALWRQIQDLPDAPALAARTVAQGLLADGMGIGHALRREWWPLGAAAVLTAPRFRISRVAVACMLAPIAWEWATKRPPLDPIRYAGIRLVDDAAYGTGVLASSWRHRTLATLRPDVRLPHRTANRRPAH